MRITHRIAPWVIAALFFIGAVFAVHQSAVGFWLEGVLRPIGSAPLYVGVTSLWGPITRGRASVEVISARMPTQLDNILITDTYTAGSTQFAPGTEIYLHVHTLGVLARETWYDEWYHAVVGDGEPVNRLRPGLGTLDAPAPIGQFDEEHYGTMVRYRSNDHEYWQITPTFLLQWRDNRDIPREGPNDITFSLQNPDGVDIRYATGLTPSSGTPDSAPADFTATSSQFSLRLNVKLSETEGGTYGRPMLSHGPWPDYQWRIGYLVIWISFNNTSIGTDYLTVNGWTRLNQVSTPGYLNFYKVLPPIAGDLNTVGLATFDIPVDASSSPSGTGISLRVWMADLQIPADAAQGIYDGAPVPYGGVAGYGVTSTIFANGFQISSNKPTGQLVWAVFKSR